MRCIIVSVRFILEGRNYNELLIKNITQTFYGKHLCLQHCLRLKLLEQNTKYETHKGKFDNFYCEALKVLFRPTSCTTTK